MFSWIIRDIQPYSDRLSVCPNNKRTLVLKRYLPNAFTNNAFLMYKYKEDLALDNLQWLICHKTNQNQIRFIFLLRYFHGIWTGDFFLFFKLISSYSPRIFYIILHLLNFIDKKRQIWRYQRNLSFHHRTDLN